MTRRDELAANLDAVRRRIEEAATTAGLHATSTFSIAGDWSATRLGSRGRGR
jgi:hypothetical protein